MASRSTERGFALAELVVCVGLLAIASAATLGAVAAVARRAQPSAVRDAAAMVAENALARARAAAAYVPIGSGVAASDAAAAGLIAAGTSSFVAGAELRAPAACGAASPPVLRLPVTTAYQGGVFHVTVAYPRDPCDPNGATLALTLRATLAPPLYAPGHVVPRPVGVPARM